LVNYDRWGDALRLASDTGGNNWKEAATAHALAAAAFDQIGDPARSVIALTDAGIDLAAAAAASPNNKAAVTEAEAVLEKAIRQTKGIRSTDLDLLRRVVSKEGEGRMALAATLWSDGQRNQAETVLGDACLRLDQLQAQLDAAAAAQKKNKGTTGVVDLIPAPRLLCSIDDDVRGVGSTSRTLDCSKFRNPQFAAETLGWPEGLQKKVTKLETLR